MPNNVFDKDRVGKLIAEQMTWNTDASGREVRVTHFVKHGQKYNSPSIEDFQKKIGAALVDPNTKIAFYVDSRSVKHWVMDAQVPMPDGSKKEMFIAVNQGSSGEFDGSAYPLDGKTTFQNKYNLISDKKTRVIKGGVPALENISQQEANGHAVKQINSLRTAFPAPATEPQARVNGSGAPPRQDEMPQPHGPTPTHAQRGPLYRSAAPAEDMPMEPIKGVAPKPSKPTPPAAPVTTVTAKETPHVTPAASETSAVTAEENIARVGSRTAASSSRMVKAGGAVLPAATGAVLEGLKAAAQGKSAKDVAAATGHGAVNGAFGVDDFKTAKDKTQRPVDRALAAGRSATATVATVGGATSVFVPAAAPIAAASGVANGVLGVAQDAAYWAHLASNPGTITQTYQALREFDRLGQANAREMGQQNVALAKATQGGTLADYYEKALTSGNRETAEIARAEYTSHLMNMVNHGKISKETYEAVDKLARRAFDEAEKNKFQPIPELAQTSPAPAGNDRPNRASLKNVHTESSSTTPPSNTTSQTPTPEPARTVLARIQKPSANPALTPPITPRLARCLKAA